MLFGSTTVRNWFGMAMFVVPDSISDIVVFIILLVCKVLPKPISDWDNNNKKQEQQQGMRNKKQPVAYECTILDSTYHLPGCLPMPRQQHRNNNQTDSITFIHWKRPPPSWKPPPPPTTKRPIQQSLPPNIDTTNINQPQCHLTKTKKKGGGESWWWQQKEEWRRTYLTSRQNTSKSHTSFKPTPSSH